MTGEAARAEAAWADADLAAALFAVDPVGTGGVVLRAGAGPVRDRWLAGLHALLGPEVPSRRVPIHVDTQRLLGGLDLAATLASGRRVAARGLLSEADGGVLLLPMAERLARATAAQLALALDTGERRLERDGLARQDPARFGAVALDEGTDDEPAPPAALTDRLAFHLDLRAVSLSAARGTAADAEAVSAARARLPEVTADASAVTALCEAAQALGVASLRAPFLALRAARAHAALARRDAVAEADIAVAGRLVLAPRMTTLQSDAATPDDEDQADEQPADSEDAQAPDTQSASDDDAGAPETAPDSLAEVVVAAARAALPEHLLAGLALARRPRAPAHGDSRAGPEQASARRGRPVGVRPGRPDGRARLNVVATLRAAAPWQPLRRRPDGPLVVVRPDDFRVTRFKQRSETTTIFAVDASGSAALHRLAEAKGAVELLLADCYRRRDRVAVVAFRGRAAEVLLPPTRSLARAKGSLAGLPGGGGTPLAAGIEAAGELAEAAARRGETPVVVLLTDGRANVGRDGGPGRARAAAEAEAAARRLAALGATALLVDTSPHGEAAAETLAAAMGGRYLALPHADARGLSAAVRANAPAAA